MRRSSSQSSRGAVSSALRRQTHKAPAALRPLAAAPAFSSSSSSSSSPEVSNVFQQTPAQGARVQFDASGRPRGAYVDRPRPMWASFRCTECMQCVEACDQNALFKFLLDKDQKEAAPPELDFKKSLEKGKWYTFLANDRCNGCGDCVERCAELPQGACFVLRDEAPDHSHELKAREDWQFALGATVWDPTDCTQCGACEDACPTHAMRVFNLTKEQVGVAPIADFPSLDTADGGKYVVQVDPSMCANCADCVEACKDVHDGVNSCFTIRHSKEAKQRNEDIYNYALSVSKFTPTNTILHKRQLDTSGKLFEMVIKAPEIARYCQAGHFLVVCIDEHAERIPLTIADFDRVNETITMVIQDVGGSSGKICDMKEGEIMASVAGPLGRQSHIQSFDKKADGKVIVVGGGAGVAPAYPVAREFQQAGNDVTTIIGYKNKDYVFWEDKMASVSDSSILMTDDGSAGEKGFVSQGLQHLIDSGEKIAEVFAVGPGPMMAAVVDVTKKYDIKTTVSINTLMVDGTGMCGCCRVEVDGQTKFACIHGPEFDGLKIDWTNVRDRQAQYLPEESLGREHLEQCRLDANVPPANVRTPMPEQDPKERVRNWKEVSTGYTPMQAIAEARRCIQCAEPTCAPGCPVQIDIPGFIKRIADGNFLGAAAKLKETNVVPAMTGRVCPQENQCEQVCIFNKENEAQEPIAIGRLERFAADYERAHKGLAPVDPIPKSGHRVAVVGSGPAGLAVSGDLAKLGHEVVIYEALHKPGGVLAYGIPEFRLPKSIVDDEFRTLASLGVQLKLSHPVGPGIKVPDLLNREKFDSVFLGLGAGAPNFLGIPGEEFNGVMSGNEFLTRVNLMKAYQFPDFETPVLAGHNPRNVAVIGAGNTAMDVARSAMRLNPDGNVYLVYRRTVNESPARAEELHHAIDEGLIVRDLTAPKEIIGEGGWVTGMRCTKMELGEPDEGGRRRPIEIPDSDHIVDVNMVVLAIGNGSNEMLTSTFPDLELNKWGNILADREGRTSYPGVFAGGDIVIGAATVIEAAGAGKRAAAAIDSYLTDPDRTWMADQLK
jgi:glutamate synthase (NADPH) small chain